MRHLAKYFLRGLVIVVPIGITIYVFWAIFAAIDRWLARFVEKPFPGLGFLITVVAVIAVGALASNFVGRKLFDWTELLFRKAPFVKIVYSAVRDLIEAFVGDKRRFNRPVLVSLTADGSLRAAGFVTREDLAFLGSVDRVAVYFPQSYNVAGNLVFVPRERVTAIEVDSTQLMSFIVSGGVSGFSGE